MSWSFSFLSPKGWKDASPFACSWGTVSSRGQQLAEGAGSWAARARASGEAVRGQRRGVL